MLCYAALHGNSKIIEILFQESQTVGGINPTGHTAQDCAILGGHTHIVEQLYSLDKNSVLQKSRATERTPLELAILGDRNAIVKFLAQKGVPLNTTHLKTALDFGHPDIAWSLITNKVKYDFLDICKLLFLAIEKNKPAILRSIMNQMNKAQKKMDWDSAINSKKETLLTAAVSHCNLECVMLLLTIGKLDINKANGNGKTPLCIAVAKSTALTKFLLEHKANPNQKTSSGLTLLMLAIQSHQFENVRLLAKNGADLQEKVLFLTPLTTALTVNALAIAYFLYLQGKKKKILPPMEDMIHLLNLAIQGKEPKIVQELLAVCDKSLDKIPQLSGYTPLMRASKACDTALVKQLLDMQANPNIKCRDIQNEFFRDFTALHFAAAKGHIETAKLLLQSNAKLDAESTSGHTPLSIAAVKGHLNMVTFLLGMGANILCRSKEDETLLMLAIHAESPETEQHLAIMRLLLQKGCDPNHKNKSGISTLDKALNQKKIGMIGVLLENGAKEKNEAQLLDILALATEHNKPTLIRKLLSQPRSGNLITQLSSSGWSALNTAVYYGHRNLVTLFIKHLSSETKSTAELGKILSIQNREGYSNLHIAAHNNRYDIACDLLDKAASLNITLPGGKTPLCLAAEIGHVNIVELLLNGGAAINHCAKDSGTALFLAVLNGHNKVIETLIKRKADLSIKGNPGDGSSLCTPLVLAIKRSSMQIIRLISDKSKPTPSEIGEMWICHFKELIKTKFTPVTKEAHFIWIGGPIPRAEYLGTLHQMATAARISGHKTILWLENPLNYYKAAALFDIAIPHLIIKNIRTLKNQIKKDPFYIANPKRLQQFENLLIREMAGFKNAAAAADVIRLRDLTAKRR